MLLGFGEDPVVDPPVPPPVPPPMPPHISVPLRPGMFYERPAIIQVQPLPLRVELPPSSTDWGKIAMVGGAGALVLFLLLGRK